MSTLKNNERNENEEKNNYTVYMHLNKTNGKRYIGITKQNVNRRWKNGWGYYVKNNTSYFWKAIQKYGWNNFEHKILHTGLLKIEADELERYYIKLYNTSNSQYGYNLTLGGDGFLGLPRSEITKQKISKSLKGKYTKERSYWYGKHIPQEMIDKQKQTKRLHPYKHTEEWKLKHSEMLKGGKNSNAKKVKCINTGEIFDCIKDASKKYSTDNSRISKCCRGLAKSSGKHPITNEKLYWKFV